MKVVMAYFGNLVDVPGGLEKNLCRLSNELIRRGHEVFIVTYDNKKGRPKYNLSEKAKLINLKKPLKTAESGLRWKIIREIARVRGKEAFGRWKKEQRGDIFEGIKCVFSEIQPDVILAYNHQTAGEIYEAGFLRHVVAMFRNDPDRLCPQMTDTEIQSIESADLVQVLLPSFKNSIRRYISNPRVVCIPNIIEIPDSVADIIHHKTTYKIIDVGRVNKNQKRQDLLIKAFANLATEYPEWELEFWGECDNKYGRSLQSWIKRRKLDKRILFKGETNSINDKYISSDIFAFPSRYEGFPNALGEAMAAGLPSIVCRDCFSCTQLIQDGVTGLIAEPNAEDIANKLKHLMGNVKLRESLGKNARKYAEKYDPKIIWDMWERILLDIAK
ncbi:glycosyltransferase [Dialister succinatiphilus]|uniref:glycosyltransferase n=1 Tax=Dialister succinatiphilus TaxID=487173 RepID=UPI004029B4F5